MKRTKKIKLNALKLAIEKRDPIAMKAIEDSRHRSIMYGKIGPLLNDKIVETYIKGD